MTRTVLLLPGDGVGPEVMAQARPLLELVAHQLSDLEVHEAEFGGIAIDHQGSALPAETLAAAKAADAVLLGAVGAPRYDELPAAERPERGLLQLRSELGVYANLRPVSVFDELASASSLRPEIVMGLDLLIVRELTGGIYFATPRGFVGEDEQRQGFNTMKYSVPEIERIAKVAFAAARLRNKELCSIDKANVLEVSILWREVVAQVGEQYPDVNLTHMYVDNAAMQLVRNPRQFDVMVTANLFGDILSDLAAELAGSIGMLPSASLGGKHGLYEPIHGSAPTLAGLDQANPCAMVLSVALMLEHSLGQPQLASCLRTAVRKVISSGLRTADIALQGSQPASCSQMGAAVLAAFEQEIAPG